jgi:YqaJ-like viral recombinase domain.|nr:MAG TPA: Exonuclease [Caudoviricetes sp.]
MKVLKIEQNSDEWLEFRKGKSGGSELKDLWGAAMPLKSVILDKLIKTSRPIPDSKHQTVPELAALLTPEELAELKLKGNPKKRYYEMLAERVARPLTPNDYADQLNGEKFTMMARGHILEPVIAKAFAKKYKKKLDADSVVWVDDDNPNSYISPDRTITGKDGKVREAIEIKALDSANVLEIWKTNEIPNEYMPQIVKYFMINEDLETLYWVVGTDLIPGLELQVFPVKRADVEDQIREIKAFELCILAMADEDVKKLDALAGF